MIMELCHICNDTSVVCPNGTFKDPESYEMRIGAASTLVIIALVGFTSNGFGIFMCFKLGSIRQVFCRLYLSVAVGDFGVLSGFAFYVAPMIMLQSDWGYSHTSLAISGFYQLVVWCVSIFSTLSLAVNRCVAATYPLKYQEIYTNRNVAVNIVFTYGISIFYSGWFLIDGCEYAMYPAYGVFTYRNTSCGDILDVFCSSVCCTIFVLIFVLNVLAVKNLRRRRKVKVGSSQVKISGKQTRQEAAFLLQACINSGLFQTFTLGFHVCSHLQMSLASRFFLKSVLWEIVHMTNGFVFLALNEDIRGEIQIILRLRKRSARAASSILLVSRNPNYGVNNNNNHNNNSVGL